MTGMIIISYEQGLGSLNLLGIIPGLLAGLSCAGFIIVSKATVANYPSAIIVSYSYLAFALFLSPLLFTSMLFTTHA